MGKLESYFKTAILLAGLTALVMGVSYALGGRSAIWIGFAISLVMNLGAYWFSDKMVLTATGAREISESDAPHIFADVRELSKEMGIPMPRLYMTDDPQPNAFATGRDPAHGAVAVTRGIVDALDRDEIRGVLAHELAHIKNYDILISTIAAVMAGTISSITDIFMWSGLLGGGRNEEQDRGPLGAVAGLISIILAPIAAMLIQFAVSRSREYAADATAAEYTKDPRSLAQALVKIQRIAQAHPMQVNPSYAPLYIQNPIGGQFFAELFSTHPLTEKRVAKLMHMK
jgi:heat shock protein HtpX